MPCKISNWHLTRGNNCSETKFTNDTAYKSNSPRFSTNFITIKSKHIEAPLFSYWTHNILSTQSGHNYFLFFFGIFTVNSWWWLLRWKVLPETEVMLFCSAHTLTWRRWCVITLTSGTTHNFYYLRVEVCVLIMFTATLPPIGRKCRCYRATDAC